MIWKSGNFWKTFDQVEELIMYFYLILMTAVIMGSVHSWPPISSGCSNVLKLAEADMKEAEPWGDPLGQEPLHLSGLPSGSESGLEKTHWLTARVSSRFLWAKSLRIRGDVYILLYSLVTKIVYH